MSLRTQAISFAALLLLLAGCSDEEPGTGLPGSDPTGTQTTAPGTNPNGAPADAPKVTNPIEDLEQFMKSPCDMVSKNQAVELGFEASAKPESDTSQGPGCQWENDAGDNFTIVLLKNQPLGISGIYRNQQQYDGFYKYFEPVDIAGYPGVFSDSYDARPSGACTLSVGVTDQQVITLTDRVQGDPCDVVKKAAEAAVTTMSKG